jgi:hypothetical protein
LVQECLNQPVLERAGHARRIRQRAIGWQQARFKQPMPEPQGNRRNKCTGQKRRRDAVLGQINSHLQGLFLQNQRIFGGT